MRIQFRTQRWFAFLWLQFGLWSHCASAFKVVMNGPAQVTAPASTTVNFQREAGDPSDLDMKLENISAPGGSTIVKTISAPSDVSKGSFPVTFTDTGTFQIVVGISTSDNFKVLLNSNTVTVLDSSGNENNSEANTSQASPFAFVTISPTSTTAVLESKTTIIESTSVSIAGSTSSSTISEIIVTSVASMATNVGYISTAIPSSSAQNDSSSSSNSIIIGVVAGVIGLMVLAAAGILLALRRKALRRGMLFIAPFTLFTDEKRPPHSAIDTHWASAAMDTGISSVYTDPYSGLAPELDESLFPDGKRAQNSANWDSSTAAISTMSPLEFRRAPPNPGSQADLRFSDVSIPGSEEPLPAYER
ncbi:hypothetical protein C8J56DRAFT_1020396 [Mycena floridula]|nr:hypothetical protein C8J56DRAFT_1020396 [Mycena floridula]